MGEQIITLQEYQSNLSSIQLFDPEMDNQVSFFFNEANKAFAAKLPAFIASFVLVD